MRGELVGLCGGLGFDLFLGVDVVRLLAELQLERLLLVLQDLLTSLEQVYRHLLRYVPCLHQQVNVVLLEVKETLLVLIQLIRAHLELDVSLTKLPSFAPEIEHQRVIEHLGLFQVLFHRHNLLLVILQHVLILLVVVQTFGQKLFLIVVLLLRELLDGHL